MARALTLRWILVLCIISGLNQRSQEYHSSDNRNLDFPSQNETSGKDLERLLTLILNATDTSLSASLWHHLTTFACSTSCLERTQRQTCKCDETCYYFQDCCFDAPSRNSNNPFSSGILKYASKLRLKELRGVDPVLEYWMVSSCPQNWSDPVSARKCTDSDLIWVHDEILDPFIFIPVTSKGDFMDFKNMYCAKCHGVSEYLFWDTGVKECYRSQDNEYVETYMGTLLNYFRNTNCR